MRERAGASGIAGASGASGSRKWRARALLAAALTAALGPACAGPCKEVFAQRQALAAAPADVTGAAHARVRIPYALANRLMADALRPPPELPVPLGKLGPLAGFIGEVRAIPREVRLEPGRAPGRVRATVRVELADGAGALLAVRASGDVAPRLAHQDGRLAVSFDPAQLSRLEPELGPRAAAALGELLAARLPASVRDRVPRIVVDRVAAAVVEEVIDGGYRLVHQALLPRLRDRTKIGVELPDVPIARVALASTPSALAIDVFTTLPVRAGVADMPPELLRPLPDEPGPGGAGRPEDAEVLVQIAGDAAARAANWGIAHGALPPRYTRSLRPAPDGAYVPHFEWRPGDPARPLVVHMFKVHGGCAHFAVGVRPHVEVTGGEVRAWIENRRLEQADGPVALELLARTKALVERSTSSRKQGPGSVRITVGDREVTTRLVRAEIAGDELRAAVALAIAPAPLLSR